MTAGFQLTYLVKCYSFYSYYLADDFTQSDSEFQYMSYMSKSPNPNLL